MDSIRNSQIKSYISIIPEMELVLPATVSLLILPALFLIALLRPTPSRGDLPRQNIGELEEWKVDIRPGAPFENILNFRDVGKTINVFLREK